MPSIKTESKTISFLFVCLYIYDTFTVCDIEQNVNQVTCCAFQRTLVHGKITVFSLKKYSACATFAQANLYNNDLPARSKFILLTKLHDHYLMHFLLDFAHKKN